MNVKDLADYTTREFERLYGQPPRWLAAAPGRVNVIGEHTDYNDGFVLPMAIERYTIVAAAPSRELNLVLRSTSETAPATFDPVQPFKPGPKGSWYNYPLGVLAGFRDLGQRIPPLDVLVHSTVPLGGGLSSSAALEVSTATMLEAVTGKKLDPVEKALLCQKAEHQYAGMPCGIMDQFISVMGRENHLLLLDCRSRETQLVPMTDPSVSVLITNTNVKHELTGGEYAQRRAQCEEAAKIMGLRSLRDATASLLESSKSRLDEVVYRRARHVVGEIARTPEAARHIQASAWAKAGQLMYDSHYSLKDDYEVSCPELDAVVEIARSIGPDGGVIGCRMTGGGFGGCAVALVRADAVDRIAAQIAREYEAKTGIQPSLFVSRPASGAMLLQG